MDDNNFLNSYKRKTGEPEGQPGGETQAEQQGPPSLRYEEKSGFVQPRLSGAYDAPAPRRRGPKPLFIAIGAAVALCAVVVLILLLNRGIAVIDLTGWAQNDALLWAKEKDVKLQIEERFNDQYDAGKIVAQDPEAGGSVAKGGFVKVFVSKGHDLSVTLDLPDIANMTKDEIDAWSNQNFMQKVRITTEYSDTVPTGKVISYEINDNTVVGNKVTRNTPIYVIVSKGRDESAEFVTVPDFREKTMADSYLFANENGITLTIVEQFDDFAPKGAVLGQSVKKDEKVRKGGTITLTVSKGKKITVPDFAGFSKQKASAVATGLGIPAAVTEKYSSARAGSFLSQSIAAGSVYEDGDVLELCYSLGNTVIIGNYVGQTRDAIEAWAAELNAQGAAITISVTQTQSSQPKGRILSQSKANTVIGIKTAIRITVSLGKAVFVPDFVAPAGSGYDVAITRDKAMAMCEALGIVPVFVKASKSGRLPGEIWYQSLAPGAEVTEGATITLKYVPANVTYVVPLFAGMTEEDIRTAGNLKKFDIKFVLSDTVIPGSEGKVVDQSQPAGTTVEAGAAITLTVGAS